MRGTICVSYNVGFHILISEKVITISVGPTIFANDFDSYILSMSWGGGGFTMTANVSSSKNL